MRMLVWVVASATLFLGTTLSGNISVAEQVNIGGTAVELVAPEGYCALEEAHAADQRLLGVVRIGIGATNRLLGMSADCDQLKKIRAGEQSFLVDYLQYQTLTQMMDEELPGEPDTFVKQVCHMLQTQGDQIMAKVGPVITKRIEAAIKNAKINSMNMVGVLAQEPEVCYFGAIIGGVSQAGNKLIQLSIGAVTVANGKLIYVFLYAPYESAQDVDAALTRHKKNVAAFRLQNK
ncbi:MAG: hypothetical protein ACK5KM_01960 [Hyphomicrobiaceae bacterium]